ncbi:MAG: sulfite exporter TauE/SafE family protein, partial [Magnetococcales bacterium]|nr:sulfite exporter TauE/SafE family protein [Magnetococcales bacterium]
FAWSGYVDIRLAMIILAGSLFGIQLGAIGTTYVKPYVIKLVMGVIMLTVMVSRALVIPVYLSQLEWLPAMDPFTMTLLKNTSFLIMILALALGAGIIVFAMIRGRRAARKDAAELALDPALS